MKFVAGETIAVTIQGNELLLKIEDASKSDTLSARVEKVISSTDYHAGQVYEFNRSEIDA